jgi:hypothetical protein
MYQKLVAVRDEARAQIARANLDLIGAKLEVEKYRNEMGYLNISDASKLHARGVRTMEENKWSWRIFVPGDRRFMLRAAINVPGDGIPSMSQGEVRVLRGEHLIDASIEPLRDGKWRLRIKPVDGPGIVTEMPEGFGKKTEAAGVFETKQEIADSGSPLVLLRKRNFENKVYWDATNGLMIWIEEAK